MFRVRKFKIWFYLVLLAVLSVTVWLNIQSLSMDTIVCTTTDGVCHHLQTFTYFRIVACGSIVLSALMLMYLYLFNSRKAGRNYSFETDVFNGKDKFEIDFALESSRNYNSF